MRIKKNIKRKFAWLVVMAMLLGMLPVPSFAYASDVSGHWAASHIEEMMGMGVIKGYPDGSFKPDKSITRAEFMVMVNTAFGFKDSVSKSYSDVSSSDWFYSAVGIASGAGYISGYSDGTIKPNNSITREEAATMLSKAAGLTGNEDAYMKFSDYMKITWSKSYVGAVSAAGIMSGYPDGSFGPSKSITRAESAVSIHKAMKGGMAKPDMSNVVVYDKQGTYGPSEGIETIEKDVVIKVPGVTLQNMIIKGDLTIDKEVGDGDVFLKNVKVEGKTNINGGGANSIHMEDTILTTVIVDKATGDIRIVISGKTVVATVELKSGAKLEESGVTGDGFRNVIMGSDIPKNSKVTLLGEFEDVNIQALSLLVDVPKGLIKNLNVEKGATDTRITLADDVKVVKAIVDAIVKFLGKGTVEVANVNISGVTFEKLPSKTETPSGVEPPKKEDGSTGGGGGSSSSSNKGSVTATTISAVTLGFTKGSINFDYGFSTTTGSISNISQLAADPYYIDFDQSKVYLKNGSTEQGISFTDLGFGTASGTMTSFSDFKEFAQKFTSFGGTTLSSLKMPTEYKIVIKSKSTDKDGKTVVGGTNYEGTYQTITDAEKQLFGFYADVYALDLEMAQLFPDTGNLITSTPATINLSTQGAVTLQLGTTVSSIQWSNLTTSPSLITLNLSGSTVTVSDVLQTGTIISLSITVDITNGSYTMQKTYPVKFYKNTP